MYKATYNNGSLSLKINNVESSFENFPIVVRLKNYNGEYLLGNDETWLSIEEINDYDF